MREILFKAKRLDNDEWVEGWLFLTKDNTYIAYANQFDDDLFISPQNIFIAVDIDTICQYTGLTDKKGKKIWENDKVYIRYTDGQSEMDDVVQVRYKNGCFNPWIWQYECDGCDLRCELLEIEVIGNIFDNLELIGE